MVESFVFGFLIQIHDVCFFTIQTVNVLKRRLKKRLYVGFWEAQDVALGDLMKSMDRHRYQTKAEMAGVFFLLICSYSFTMDFGS